MTKGYWVAFADVNDPEGYKAYIAENAKAFRKYGGRFLTRGGKSETLEGKPRVGSAFRAGPTLSQEGSDGSLSTLGDKLVEIAAVPISGMSAANELSTKNTQAERECKTNAAPTNPLGSFPPGMSKVPDPLALGVAHDLLDGSAVEDWLVCHVR